MCTCVCVCVCACMCGCASMSTPGHLLSQRARAECGSSVDLTCRAKHIQEPGCHRIWVAPAMRRGEVLLIALQKECLEPQAYTIALLV